MSLLLRLTQMLARPPAAPAAAGAPSSGVMRFAIAGLTLSASAFVARTAHEGYTDAAIIPTTGDVPTMGFGSTVKDDGSRVKMGDRTTPTKALRTALVHFQRDEAKLKACLPGVELSQVEFDVYSELAYNIGSTTFCTSKATGAPGVIPTRLRARDYAGACDAILQYKFAGGYDCSTLIDGQPNKRCYGVWKDRLRLHATCKAAQ